MCNDLIILNFALTPGRGAAFVAANVRRTAGGLRSSAVQGAIPDGVELSSDMAEIQEMHSTRRHGEHAGHGEIHGYRLGLSLYSAVAAVAAVAAVSVVTPC